MHPAVGEVVQIQVKLFATFRQYLPEGSGSQGIRLEIAQDSTPLQVLQRLGVPVDAVHLVMINGEYIEPDRRHEAIFHDQDVLAVWPAVAGG